MSENMKTSLDDQIKDAELAKLKAETAEIKRRSGQVRILGVPIVQIVFGGIVVGFILLNYIRPLVDLNTDITTKGKEYNEIKNRLERIELEAHSEELERLSNSLRIEQAELKDRTVIMGIFGTLDSLEYANVLKNFQMIKANNFYDSRINPKGKGVDNQYQPQQGNSLIYDAATGLTWQQSGSKMYFSWEQAQDYIRKLNSASHGGYVDWRLPTLKEAMSIVEQETNGRGVGNVSQQFDEYQEKIWTSDRFSTTGAWAVRFTFGYINFGGPRIKNFFSSCTVRAVRGGQF